MALQSTANVADPLRLSEIKTEFSATGTRSLTEFVKGGTYVPNTTTNATIPTAAPITILNFLGGSAVTGPTVLNQWNITTAYDSYTYYDFYGNPAAVYHYSGYWITNADTITAPRGSISGSPPSTLSQVYQWAVETYGATTYYLTFSLRTYSDTSSTPASIFSKITVNNVDFAPGTVTSCYYTAATGEMKWLWYLTGLGVSPLWNKENSGGTFTCKMWSP